MKDIDDWVNEVHGVIEIGTRERREDSLEQIHREWVLSHGFHLSTGPMSGSPQWQQYTNAMQRRYPDTREPEAIELMRMIDRPGVRPFFGYE